MTLNKLFIKESSPGKGGLPLRDYLKAQLNAGKFNYDELVCWNDEKRKQFKNLLENLKKIDKDREHYQNHIIGQALQDIVTFILESYEIFEVKERLLTSTNEIDQLIMLNDLGNYYKSLGLIDIKGDYFVSECKNYATKVGVTWIGKFYSLVLCCNCELGVIFSYHGLTGSGWDDAVGLTKKLLLARESLEKKIYIVDINIIDFEKLEKGENFLSILKAKITAIVTDTSIDQYITKHPAEKEL